MERNRRLAPAQGKQPQHSPVQQGCEKSQAIQGSCPFQSRKYRGTAAGSDECRQYGRSSCQQPSGPLPFFVFGKVVPFHAAMYRATFA